VRDNKHAKRRTGETTEGESKNQQKQEGQEATCSKKKQKDALKGKRQNGGETVFERKEERTGGEEKSGGRCCGSCFVVEMKDKRSSAEEARSDWVRCFVSLIFCLFLCFLKGVPLCACASPGWCGPRQDALFLVENSRRKEKK